MKPQTGATVCFSVVFEVVFESISCPSGLCRSKQKWFEIAFGFIDMIQLVPWKTFGEAFIVVLFCAEINGRNLLRNWSRSSFCHWLSSQTTEKQKLCDLGFTDRPSDRPEVDSNFIYTDVCLKQLKLLFLMLPRLLDNFAVRRIIFVSLRGFIWY